MIEIVTKVYVGRISGAGEELVKPASSLLIYVHVQYNTYDLLSDLDGNIFSFFA